jgi:K+-transporting ATPase ATPase C chain
MHFAWIVGRIERWHVCRRTVDLLICPCFIRFYNKPTAMECLLLEFAGRGEKRKTTVRDHGFEPCLRGRVLSEAEQPDRPEGEETASPDVPRAALGAQVRPAITGALLLTLLTGVGFPLALGLLARSLFPHQADGSLIERNGIVVGSELIGQRFTKAGYFHFRPSAAGDGYDATASGGSNLGPSNPKLRDSVRRRAEEFRRGNGLSPEDVVPIDAVTSSGSGLDPHISPENAALQIGRVAHQRHLSEDAVRQLVNQHTSGRQLGFLGEPRVVVLPLNLELDRISPIYVDRPGRPD